MHAALLHTAVCIHDFCLQAEMKRPRFEEDLEGVLDLADSISLKDTLTAADLDVNAHGKATSATKEAVAQSVEESVAEATLNV